MGIWIYELLLDIVLATDPEEYFRFVTSSLKGSNINL